MDEKNNIINKISIILSNAGIKNIYSIRELNIGFNRLVFEINEKYLLKICLKNEKEKGIINETSFYINNSSNFHPQVLFCDFSKKDIPYIYTLEEKIEGKTLFDVWDSLNIEEKKDVLEQLICIIKSIHSTKVKKIDSILYIQHHFDANISNLTNQKIISKEQIDYIYRLKNILPEYFKDAKSGYIHGDIHFNNILYTNNGIKLIDFECYEVAPLDKEFDSISRMIRNPNSFINKESQKIVNPSDYSMIMYYIIDAYPEICKNNNFDNRLLIYDCLNSLKWLRYYPKYKLYNEILFEKSKKLLK